MDVIKLLQNGKNSVVAGFSGRINDGNAEAVGKELFRIRKENRQGVYVLILRSLDIFPARDCAF